MRTTNTIHLAFLTFLLAFIAPFAGLAAGEETPEAVPEPVSIDIFDPAVGDFLDFDLAAYEQAAWQAYSDGDYETAAGYYLAFLQYDIADGGNIYNLACCYGLLGEADLAARYLERAVSAGYTDIEHIMWDPDFDSVRGTEIFDSTVETLAAIAAEEKAGLGTTTWTMSNDFLPCNVQVPENFNLDEPHTLIIGLHGYGSSPERFIGLWKRFENPDFIYAAPRAPYAFSTGGELGYSWNTGDETTPDLWPRSVRTTTAYVTHVVDNLKSQYNIDKVYLLGFSQGCMMTYIVGLENPELFDGLICFGGWLDVEWLGEETIAAASGLDIFIGHGNEDRMVEFQSGLDAKGILEGYGYNVTFYEFAGPHTVPEEALHEVQTWMAGL